MSPIHFLSFCKVAFKVSLLVCFVTYISGCNDPETSFEEPDTLILSAENGPPDEIIVSWNESPDVTSYNLLWSNTAGATVLDGNGIENVTSPYTHSNLAAGIRYYYSLSAVVDMEESIISFEANAIPLPAFSSEGSLSNPVEIGTVHSGTVAGNSRSYYSMPSPGGSHTTSIFSLIRAASLAVTNGDDFQTTICTSNNPGLESESCRTICNAGVCVNAGIIVRGISAGGTSFVLQRD